MLESKQLLWWHFIQKPSAIGRELSAPPECGLRAVVNHLHCLAHEMLSTCHTNWAMQVKRRESASVTRRFSAHAGGSFSKILLLRSWLKLFAGTLEAQEMLSNTSTLAPSSSDEQPEDSRSRMGNCTSSLLSYWLADYAHADYHIYSGLEHHHRQEEFIDETEFENEVARFSSQKKFINLIAYTLFIANRDTPRITSVPDFSLCCFCFLFGFHEMLLVRSFHENHYLQIPLWFQLIKNSTFQQLAT